MTRALTMPNISVDTSSIKAQEISQNSQKVVKKITDLKDLARAVGHLNKETERGEHAPYKD